jgi:hypothetical protein
MDNFAIRRIVEEADKFSDVYVVSYATFFDGTADEDLYLDLGVDHLITELPEGDLWYMHDYAREKGFKMAKYYDAYFFIDSDELPEGELVAQWLKTYDGDTDHKFANYWYYREPIYRADEVEDSVVLVSRKTIDRLGFYQTFAKDRDSLSDSYIHWETLDGHVLFHHYSWAKPKESMYKKIQTFAHQNDMDWKVILDQEYAREFNYTCPFNNYTFKQVKTLL